jgi:hypothetical protein
MQAYPGNIPLKLGFDDIIKVFGEALIRDSGETLTQ